MKIPITTNFKRVKIRLYLEGETGKKILLRVSDPRYPRTDYLRRRVPFTHNRFREIEIPLPFSPRTVLLETRGRAVLRDIRKELMEETKVWAKPERHRFMDLATLFAKRAGYLPVGNYTTSNKEFRIEYLNVIRDLNGNPLSTPARINRDSGRVQIARNQFQTFSIPVRLAILAHEGCHFFLNTRSEERADLCGMKWYLDSGFPKIEAVYAATKVFRQFPDMIGPEQLERTRTLIEFIKNHPQSHGRNQHR